MDHFVESAIREWALAKKSASVNSSLMCGNPSKAVVDECVHRMHVLGAAEEQLFNLDGRKDIPGELVVFLQASADRGCSACWVSSAGPMHPECGKKIDRYFRTQDTLYRFGLMLDTSSSTD